MHKVIRIPDEIASILFEILEVSILRIRNSSLPQYSAACFLEADHVHNIPILLRFNSADMLRQYLNSIPSFTSESHRLGRSVAQFEPLWDQLKTAWRQHQEFR